MTGRPAFLIDPASIWAPFQYQIRRLIVRPREVSKPRDWQFKLLHRFDIWSAAVLPRCLSNFRAIGQFKILIPGLWDFLMSYVKTSYLILKRGAGHYTLCQIGHKANLSKYACLRNFVIYSELPNTSGGIYTRIYWHTCRVTNCQKFIMCRPEH